MIEACNDFGLIEIGSDHLKLNFTNIQGITFTLKWLAMDCLGQQTV